MADGSDEYTVAAQSVGPVDRDSPVPFCAQVKAHVREAIDRDQWRPGDLLPSEFDLCRMFGVSRIVIRQAFQELQAEGLVIRERGRGTFVARPKIDEGLVQSLTGFYSDMVARGHTPVTRVLLMEVQPADASVAEALRLEPGTAVIRLDRLRFVEGEPIVFVTTCLPADRCRSLLGEDFSRQSLYAVLESKCGLVIETGRRTLEAVAATEEDAHLLQIGTGAPLMRLDSVGCLGDGVPIEYYRALHRGDRSRFEVQLIRTRAGDSSQKG